VKYSTSGSSGASKRSLSIVVNVFNSLNGWLSASFAVTVPDSVLIVTDGNALSSLETRILAMFSVQTSYSISRICSVDSIIPVKADCVTSGPS